MSKLNLAEITSIQYFAGCLRHFARLAVTVFVLMLPLAGSFAQASTSWQSIFGDRPDLASTGIAIPSGQKKAPVMVLFLHGLYGDRKQFERYSLRLMDFGIPSVRLTLPGHDFDSGRSEVVSIEEWRAAVESVVAKLRPLTEKLLVVGQSTGGALALMAAIDGIIGDSGTDTEKASRKIDGLWLIEPALRVRPMVRGGACFMSRHTDDMRNYPILARLVGSAYDESTPKISPRMGCLVGSLWSDFAQALTGPIPDSDGASMYFELVAKTRTLIESSRLPVFLLNTVGDRLVDDHFLGLLKGVPNLEIAETGSRQHGLIVIDNLNLTDHILRFLEMNAEGSNFIKKALTAHRVRAIQFYGNAEGREGDLKFQLETWDRLVQSRSGDTLYRTKECESYVLEVKRQDGTAALFEDSRVCLSSLGLD